MAVELPPAGSVIRYPYLWRSQRDEGETEGRKNRPVCLAVHGPHPSGAGTALILLAISTKPMRGDQAAIPIPEIECRRAGLDPALEGWVYVDEYNLDVAERSFHYAPGEPVLGRFSARFLSLVLAAFRPHFARGRTSMVKRV
jgi:hypothetical protein